MITIQDNINLEISKNGLNAYINILKNNDKNIKHDPDKIISEIEKHIKFGLNKKLLKDINNPNFSFEKKCIAQGKEPIHGKDGSIKRYFQLDRSLIPMLREDGTVDYRELNSVNNIFKDKILAEIIPPTEGSVGRKVTGEEIPFKKGKFPKFKKGENTYISEDGLYLKSSIDGIIELRNGNIKVSELLIVDNIDSSVGNIDFSGNITVNKDVLNGFKLKAGGAVEVKGSLEGGYIQTEGNVLIRQGIQGFNKLCIDIMGNLGTKFIENAIVKVGGNITAEAIMHSDVSSKSNILLVGKKGLIVGGHCIANYEIRAKIVGSAMATKTTLQVGANLEIMKKHSELEKEIETDKANLKKINQSLKILDVLKKSNKLDEAKEKLHEDLLNAEKSLNLKISRLENEFNKINEELENLTAGRIKVADTIYPGAKIVIGKNILFIREEMKRCTFYVERNEIRVGPY